MNALADLHLARGHVEQRLGLAGQGAAAETHGHGAGAVVSLLGDADQVVEGDAICRGGTGGLEDGEGADVAAALLSLLGLGGGDVVGDVEGAAVDAVLDEAVAGHVEVHLVAGVVTTDDEDARALVDGAGDAQDVLGRGRGEDVADDGGVHEAVTDDAAERGIVAGAATVDDGDLALGHLGRACDATGDLNDVVRVGGDVALEHVLAEGLRIVVQQVLSPSFI